MVAEVKEEAKTFRTIIYDWMDEEVDRGLPPDEAAANVAMRAIQSGFLPELFKEIGPSAIHDYWRQRRGADRRNAFTRQGLRRYRAGALNDEQSVWDRPVALGGGIYKAAGALTYSDIKTIVANYLGLEKGIVGWRKSWEQVQRALKRDDSQTTSDRFTEEQFIAVFKGLIHPDNNVLGTTE